MTGGSRTGRGRGALALACTLGLALALALAAPASAAPAAQSAAPAAAGQTGQGPSAEHPVDINTASEEALIELPGVGPAMARRIVDFRKEHGPFRRVEDLMKVKGIGEKSFAKLRPLITVGTTD